MVFIYLPTYFAIFHFKLSSCRSQERDVVGTLISYNFRLLVLHLYHFEHKVCQKLSRYTVLSTISTLPFSIRHSIDLLPYTA